MQRLSLGAAPAEVDLETEHRLEASADNLSLADQQRQQRRQQEVGVAVVLHAVSPAAPLEGGAAGAAAAESEGEGEVEAAAAEGDGGAGEGGSPRPALHLSPSAQATQQMLANLAELAAAGKPGCGAGALGAGGAAAAGEVEAEP